MTYDQTMQWYDTSGRCTREDLAAITKAFQEEPPWDWEEVPGYGRIAVLRGPKRHWPVRLWRWVWMRFLRRRPYWYSVVYLTDHPTPKKIQRET